MEISSFALLFPIVVLVLLAFWIWMLVDCATKEPSQGNEKLVWILIILLANWIGAAVYFFVRRPRRKREVGR